MFLLPVYPLYFALSLFFRASLAVLRLYLSVALFVVASLFVGTGRVLGVPLSYALYFLS